MLLFYDFRVTKIQRFQDSCKFFTTILLQEQFRAITFLKLQVQIFAKSHTGGDHTDSRFVSGLLDFFPLKHFFLSKTFCTFAALLS